MRVEFDEEKDAVNRQKHGISLARAVDFDFDSAVLDQDRRKDYGEIRWWSLGFLDALLYVLVFVDVVEDEDMIRPISLRKATKTEQKLYAQANEKDG